MAEPSNDPDHTTTTSWGTLEELLLACAVNRYGTNSWDSIAKELQKRSLSFFTPNICQQKYRDLKRRFSSVKISGENSSDDSGIRLDELRKLRVAELKRELERYDLSIVSLQLKVKRLKEERERGLSLKEDEKEEREIPDLKNNLERETEPESEPVKPDRIIEPAVVEDSCDGSSNSEKARESKRVDSVELRESVAESKGEEGVKENSDVYSTARRESKRREKKPVAMVVSSNSSGEDNQSAATKTTSNGKSQPLIDLLEAVRGRKLGSVFGDRFDRQESSKYRNLIRQHIDLGMIQRRLEEGQYSDCHTKFYRDLMLFVNNIIIFFTNKSLEHKAALELRQLVSDHSRANLNPHKSQAPKPSPSAPLPKPPKSEPVSATDHVANLKPKLAITGPVIACRKRSSIAGKPAPTGEKKELAGEKPAAGEKTASSFSAVTKKRTRDQSIGSRSSSGKESSGNMHHPSPSPSAAQPPSPNTTLVSAKGEKSEPKGDKKKPRAGGSSSKVKQGSESGDGLLVDLLKNATGQKSGNNGVNKGNKHRDGASRNGLGGKSGKEKGKRVEGKESPTGRSTGRQPKRAAAVAAMGKRARDGGREVESLPKKRQRK